MTIGYGAKIYSKKDDKANDPRAREEAIKYFIPQIFPNHFTEIRHTEDEWAPDLNTFVDGKPGKIKFECELRGEKDWPSESDFPYGTVHIPPRKYHLTKDINVLFLSFNEALNRAVILKAKDVKEAKQDVRNNVHAHGEAFSDVPVHVGIFFKKTNGVWVRDEDFNEFNKQAFEQQQRNIEAMMAAATQDLSRFL